jgi:hypothetical protein
LRHSNRQTKLPGVAPFKLSRIGPPQHHNSSYFVSLRSSEASKLIELEQPSVDHIRSTGGQTKLYNIDKDFPGNANLELTCYAPSSVQATHHPRPSSQLTCQQHHHGPIQQTCSECPGRTCPDHSLKSSPPRRALGLSQWSSEEHRAYTRSGGAHDSGRAAAAQTQAESSTRGS